MVVLGLVQGGGLSCKWRVLGVVSGNRRVLGVVLGSALWVVIGEVLGVLLGFVRV